MATYGADLEAEAHRRIADLRGALDRNPTEARAALRTILAGPILCTPVTVAAGERFRMTGEAMLSIPLDVTERAFRQRPQGDSNPR